MKNRFIVVTGCSTGIGKACALRLAKEGFTVFATVRKNSDGEALKKEAPANLSAILLDVTKPESLEQAINEIGNLTNFQLYGLVNNAGIATGGPLECLPMDKIRQVWEVNVLGLIATTQAFLPFLKSHHGRIVNIGSSSGLVPMPLMSTYSATKAAVQALSDSLRMELKPLGIHVSLIAPGKIESEIWGKARIHAKEFYETTDPQTLSPYRPFLHFYDKMMLALKPIPADSVVEAVLHALTAKHPRPRYIVGNDAKGAALFSYLPRKIKDWLIAKVVGL